MPNIGGRDVPPKADPKPLPGSVVTYDQMKLANNCIWKLVIQTSVTTDTLPGQDPLCVMYYYTTTVTLSLDCGTPPPKVVSNTPRTVSVGPLCGTPSKAGPPAVAPGPPPPPNEDARLVSTGPTPNTPGSTTDILAQPDGTQTTVQYDGNGVTVTVTPPDGTSPQTLHVP
jgi:YD repeat-containing protein